MHIKTLTHRQGEGWLAPLPTDMDSPNTLVLAFGASAYADAPAPFAELAAAFPRSVLAGCSTSGEIAGTEVSDASISLAVARFERTTLQRAMVEVVEVNRQRLIEVLLRVEYHHCGHQLGDAGDRGDIVGVLGKDRVAGAGVNDQRSL